MAYPMTWQRFVRRNRLFGGYATVPEAWSAQVNVNNSVSPDAAFAVLGAQRDRILRYEKQASLLAGALARLVEDGQDEEALCAQVAARAGVARDVVAGVLQAFFAL